jgi:ribonuclease HI
MSNIIECYTDASYSPQTGLCVVGYKIGNHNIVTECLTNTKNTQAELYAVEKCIEICNNVYGFDINIIIYTDCQRAMQNNYSTNDIKVNLIKLDGHKKGVLKSDKDKIFSLVDKKVRKVLRENVRNI